MWMSFGLQKEPVKFSEVLVTEFPKSLKTRDLVFERLEIQVSNDDIDYPSVCSVYTQCTPREAINLSHSLLQ